MDRPTEGQLLAAAVMDLVLTGHCIQFVEMATRIGYWCFVLTAADGSQATGDGAGLTKMEALENMFADRAYMRL